LPTSFLLTVVAFLVTLGLVVIVHELGHFLFCKIFGIYVKTFSIGIGPKVLRKRWGETEYVLSAIPFGGYVKMAGEGMMEEIQDTGTGNERKYPLGTQAGYEERGEVDDHIPPERHLNTRPAWQRLLVFVAGPLFNLILAFVLYSGLILANGLQTIPTTTVGVVREDTPAAEAGLRVGDVIEAVGGTPVHSWGDILANVLPEEVRNLTEAPPVDVLLKREGRELTLPVQPRFDPGTKVWTLGIEPWNTRVGLVKRGGPAARLGLKTGDRIISVDGQEVTSFNGIARIVNDRPDQEIELVWERDGRVMRGMVVPELREVGPGDFKGRIFFEPYFAFERVGLGEALGLGYRQTEMTIRMTLRYLWDGVRRKLGLDAVGGPLRIGQAAGEMLSWSVSHLLQFIAFFSVNLFLLNLMPIPVLDGGHVLFLLLEVVRGGRPVPERLQAIATQVGLILLLMFMTFVVVLDVWKVTGH